LTPTGCGNMAETVQSNSQPSTSYLTPVQCMGLSATIWTLETTFGFGATGSTEICRQPTSKTAVDRSSIDCQPFTADFRRKKVPNSHFRPNRKWKYGENPTFQLAAIDFLFDPNTLYMRIGHRFDARNYFRFRRNRKYFNLTSAKLRNDSR